MIIGVLGDGWLAEGFGFEYLSARDFGIRVFEDRIEGDLGFFERLDVLVCLIPFRRDLVDPWVYFRMMERVAEAVLKFGVSRVVWAGSTAVYKDTERGRVLLAAEELFMQLAGVDVSALRIGGMIGPGRDSRQRLEQFIAEGRDISELMVPINIVRREFVCEIVETSLMVSGKRRLKVVEDLFETRFEYYRSLGWDPETSSG